MHSANGGEKTLVSWDRPQILYHFIGAGWRAGKSAEAGSCCELQEVARERKHRRISLDHRILTRRSQLRCDKYHFRRLVAGSRRRGEQGAELLKSGRRVSTRALFSSSRAVER